MRYFASRQGTFTPMRHLSSVAAMQVAVLALALLGVVFAPEPMRVSAARVSESAGRARLVCSGETWTLIGSGWRLPSVQSFAASGGRLVPSAVKRARQLPDVQYWVLGNPNFIDTCARTRTVSIEVGRNSTNGVYLVAISVQPLTATLPRVPVAAPPNGHCLPARASPFTGRVLRANQFPGHIADYAVLRQGLNGFLVTSAWQEARNGQYITVFAGAPNVGPNKGRGMIEVTASHACAGRVGPASVDTTAQRTGPLTLTRVTSSAVFFTFPGGSGVLYLRSHRFAMHRRPK